MKISESISACLLKPAELTRVYHATVGAGLMRDREALLAAISSAFLASLPTTNKPNAQLLLDLHEMNRARVLMDGTVPLRDWLTCAKSLVGGRQEKTIFERALRLLALELIPLAEERLKEKLRQRDADISNEKLESLVDRAGYIAEALLLGKHIDPGLFTGLA